MTDLCTRAELASALQVDQVDNATADLALQSAQALVRAFARQNFDSRTYTGPLLVTSDSDGWRVDLPQRPVTAVTAVSVNGIPLATGVGYAWNGLSPRVRLAVTRITTAWPLPRIDPTATVTYTAGYTVIPDDVRGVILDIAARRYTNPEQLRSETIDDYAKTWAGSDADMASALRGVERDVLLDYRRRSGSVRVRT